MRKVLFMIWALLIAQVTVHQSSFAATVVIPPAENTVIDPTNPSPEKLKAALEEFKNLSRKDKKERFKEVRALIREYKKHKKDGDVSTSTILLAILALILPPLAVYLHEGETNNKFWIDLILAIIGLVGVFAIGWYCWLAAVVYALIIVLQGNV